MWKRTRIYRKIPSTSIYMPLNEVFWHKRQEADTLNKNVIWSLNNYITDKGGCTNMYIFKTNLLQCFWEGYWPFISFVKKKPRLEAYMLLDGILRYLVIPMFFKTLKCCVKIKIQKLIKIFWQVWVHYGLNMQVHCFGMILGKCHIFAC